MRSLGGVSLPTVTEPRRRILSFVEAPPACSLSPPPPRPFGGAVSGRGLALSLCFVVSVSQIDYESPTTPSLSPFCRLFHGFSRSVSLCITAPVPGRLSPTTPVRWLLVLSPGVRRSDLLVVVSPRSIPLSLPLSPARPLSTSSRLLRGSSVLRRFLAFVEIFSFRSFRCCRCCRPRRCWVLLVLVGAYAPTPHSSSSEGDLFACFSCCV